MMDGKSDAPPVVAVGMPHRMNERFVVSQPSRVKATWLVAGRAFNSLGKLVDISTDGFCARMSVPPPRGRIIHAHLLVSALPGMPQESIEAGVRVCGIGQGSGTREADRAWLINCAIEAIHPDGRQEVSRVVELMRLAQPGPDVGAGNDRNPRAPAPDGGQPRSSYLRIRRFRPLATGR